MSYKGVIHLPRQDFNAKAKNGGNKPFMGRIVSDLHLVYTI